MAGPKESKCMKQDTQVSPLAKDSKSKPKGKPETGPSTASLKALQKEVTACLMLVCDTLLPLSVTDPVYAKLVRTQSMVLNVQDQLTALAGALPTLPPVDAGSMVIPAEARATVTEVKSQATGIAASMHWQRPSKTWQPLRCR